MPKTKQDGWKRVKHNAGKLNKATDRIAAEGGGAEKAAQRRRVTFGDMEWENAKRLKD